MIEKRNRNGGRQAPDEDTDVGDETTALKEPEAPVGKPAVEPARPAREAPSHTRGLAKRLFALLLVIALAALLYHYWGFWKGEQGAQTAPPPPAVTVSKPLVKDMQEWS